MDWTKKTYLQHIRLVYAALLATHGFEPAGTFYRRQQSAEVEARVGIQTITSKLQASVVSMNVDAAITLVSVAVLCEDIFGRARDTHVIGGPIGRFTERNDALTEYRFDWQQSDKAQFAGVARDLDAFSTFAAGINGSAELATHRLQQLPRLRRNFSEGLGETYRFTSPEVAAVIHHLNGEAAAAAAAFEIVRASKSGRLGPDALSQLAAYLGIDL